MQSSRHGQARIEANVPLCSISKQTGRVRCTLPHETHERRDPSVVWSISDEQARAARQDNAVGDHRDREGPAHAATALRLRADSAGWMHSYQEHVGTLIGPPRRSPFSGDERITGQWSHAFITDRVLHACMSDSRTVLVTVRPLDGVSDRWMYEHRRAPLSIQIVFKRWARSMEVSG